MTKKIFGLYRKLIDDEDGSATIESLLWIPMFFFTLVLIIDTSFIFFAKAQALRFIQDGNRALSVGALADTDAAQDFISASVSAYSSTATVQTTIVDGIIISTTVVMPANELTLVGTLPIFDNTLVRVTAEHFLEQ